MATPVASYENPRYHGPRSARTGRSGTRSEKVAEVTQATTIQAAENVQGGHNSTDPSLTIKQQPRKPGTRTSFHYAVHTQERIITASKRNNEIQNTTGKHP
jgi:hypothetical protein